MSIAIFDSVVEFIQHLLQSDASTVTLISCSTRDAFIEELYADIQAQSLTRERFGSTRAEENGGEAAEEDEKEDTENHHWLLSNTLDLISRSQRVKLVFCPAIEHLRAYLGCAFRVRKNQDGQEGGSSLYQGSAVLAVVNMVSIHSSTVEFSAQGLSRTSALAVEAATREGVELVLCECKPVHDGDEAERGSRIWDAQVPLLNSMTRSVREGLSGVKTVRVKQIMKKWFRFDGAI
ncbi:hypothetical protein McanMca71_002080 [Microsporum canis]|uniref:Uncharacterized protein n=1 Tax=Arthroderma otae (strain ATCC MYA-4605 / CBS 113480) TaxID=554155 RepID=C5FJJ0_ARTOC|nr:conserved hypothetical protein [Microsporum canis CBS 113480]EEQ30851.1 conserved hypothetical protein [Microsporum canis CBS 113480]